MHIDKLIERYDGCYYDKDNCCYDTIEDFLQIDILGFCGCGNLKKNLLYIKNGLSYINELVDIDTESDLNKFHKLHADWVKRGQDVFGNKQSRQFFFYWCHKEGLTEHGGSIPGWLTDSGKGLLEDLKKLF